MSGDRFARGRARGPSGGAVLLSSAVIEWDESVSRDVGLGLGPVAVLPEFQRRGIGSLLIKHGLEMARDRGASFVCVLGDPAFYGKLGFQPAARFGVFSEFGGADNGAFQIIWLNETNFRPSRGLAKYRPEFSMFEPDSETTHPNAETETLDG